MLVACGAATPAVVAPLGVEIPNGSPVSMLVLTKPVEHEVRAVMNTPRAAVRPNPGSTFALDHDWYEEHITEHADGTFSIPDEWSRNWPTKRPNSSPATPNSSRRPGRSATSRSPVTANLSSANSARCPAASWPSPTPEPRSGSSPANSSSGEILTGKKHPMLATFRPGRSPNPPARELAAEAEIGSNHSREWATAPPSPIRVPVYFEGMDVLDWLLDADPSIRWQVLRDLTDAPAEDVHTERAKRRYRGWGAGCCAEGEDGQWDASPFFPSPYDHSEGPALDRHDFSLLLLREFGLEPQSEGPAAPLPSCENSRWEEGGQPFFHGEVEPCINGMAVALEPISAKTSTAWSRGCSANSSRTAAGTARRNGAPPGHPSPPRSTCSKGCWNTNAPPAGRRVGRGPAARRGVPARTRLLRRKSTGELIERTGCSSPTRRAGFTTCSAAWTTSGTPAAPRTNGSRKRLSVLRSKRQPDGTGLLKNTHPGRIHFALEDGDGRPSRWNTLRALRVLKWYEQARAGK